MPSLGRCWLISLAVRSIDHHYVRLLQQIKPMKVRFSQIQSLLIVFFILMVKNNLVKVNIKIKVKVNACSSLVFIICISLVEGFRISNLFSNIIYFYSLVSFFVYINQIYVIFYVQDSYLHCNILHLTILCILPLFLLASVSLWIFITLMVNMS